jgi:MFS family permease
LLADSFPRQDRARAVALYMLGGPLSVVIGFFAAGWVNQIYGWRTTFFVLGLPGIALALLARFTLKEPRRALVVPQPYTSFEDVCRTLWRNGTFRHLLLNFSVVAFFNYGITQWKPAFFIRSFGFETGQLGTWFAAIYGTCGLIGSLAGGEWASRRAANDERRQLTVMAAVICACGGISALMYLSTNRYVALGLMALLAVGGAAINGPLLATIQTLIPQRMRAMSIAVIYLFANLIGMGLGPVAAGALSDALRPRFGEESLRYALLAMCPGYLWAAAHIWSASKTVARDLKVAQAQDLP